MLLVRAEPHFPNPFIGADGLVEPAELAEVVAPALQRKNTPRAVVIFGASGFFVGNHYRLYDRQDG